MYIDFNVALNQLPGTWPNLSLDIDEDKRGNHRWDLRLIESAVDLSLFLAKR